MQYRPGPLSIFLSNFYKIKYGEGVPGHGKLHGRGL